MTNYDHITRTVDGLADFLLHMVGECEKDCPIYEYCRANDRYDLECNEVWVKWLQMPTKVEN